MIGIYGSDMDLQSGRSVHQFEPFRLHRVRFFPWMFRRRGKFAASPFDVQRSVSVMGQISGSIGILPTVYAYHDRHYSVPHRGLLCWRRQCWLGL